MIFLIMNLFIQYKNPVLISRKISVFLTMNYRIYFGGKKGGWAVLFPYKTEKAMMKSDILLNNYNIMNIFRLMLTFCVAKNAEISGRWKQNINLY